MRWRFIRISHNYFLEGFNSMRNHVRKTALRSTAAVSSLLVIAVALANPASAHMGITANGATLTAGKGATIFLRPGHGCMGQATNTITVTIPDGVTGVKPQQKAGWVTSTTPTTVSWTGGALPDDQFDDFGIKLTFPALSAGVKSAPVYFKAVQVCDAEITVTRSDKNATVTGTIPAYAGKKVALFVDQIPLTKNDVTVGSDGKFSVTTTSTKIKEGSDVIAKIAGRQIANSIPGQDAWVQIPVAGSTASLSSPAPSLTILAP
jgi:uncharacterized protein YcnI